MTSTVVVTGIILVRRWLSCRRERGITSLGPAIVGLRGQRSTTMACVVFVQRPPPPPPPSNPLLCLFCAYCKNRVMAHRSVTVLVTDGDVRSLQAALWSGKPSVVLPTSPDQVSPSVKNRIRFWLRRDLLFLWSRYVFCTVYVCM